MSIKNMSDELLATHARDLARRRKSVIRLLDELETKLLAADDERLRRLDEESPFDRIEELTE